MSAKISFGYTILNNMQKLYLHQSVPAPSNKQMTIN